MKQQIQAGDYEMQQCKKCAEYIKDEIRRTEVPFDEESSNRGRLFRTPVKFKASVVKGRNYYFVPVEFNVLTTEELAVFRDTVIDEIVDEAAKKFNSELSVGERRVSGPMGYKNYGVYCEVE